MKTMQRKTIFKYEPEKHRRRSIRLKDYDYSQPGSYFVTICTYNREYLFGEIINGEMVLNEFGEIVRNEWSRISGIYPDIIVDEFVIMPNHLHGILIITNNVGAIHELPLQPESIKQRRIMTIPKIIGRFKMNSAKQINQLRKTPGIPFWQRNYYEHIIRNENELNKIREYIINNPLQWELDIENPSNIRRYKNISDYFNETIR